MKDTNEKNILVLGGTGKTGSRIVRGLQEKGISPRIGSRSGFPRFDWEDNTTWVNALRGITTVYISFQPDLAIPGAVETIHAFAELAVASGVKKMVLLSGRGEPEAAECEAIIMNAGAAWTIIRSSWFNQNFSEGPFLELLLSGTVALPVGDIPEPFIDADDIAAVAVAALTSAAHDGKLYEITGPRLITFREAVDEIARATGKPIQYEQVPAAAFTAALAEQQVPREYVQLLNYLYTEVMDGRNASITNGVQAVLGREPVDFATYASKTAATGIWN